MILHCRAPPRVASDGSAANTKSSQPRSPDRIRAEQESSAEGGVLFSLSKKDKKKRGAPFGLRWEAQRRHRFGCGEGIGGCGEKVLPKFHTEVTTLKALPLPQPQKFPPSIQSGVAAALCHRSPKGAPPFSPRSSRRSFLAPLESDRSYPRSCRAATTSPTAPETDTAGNRSNPAGKSLHRFAAALAASPRSSRATPPPHCLRQTSAGPPIPRAGCSG